MNVAQSFSGQIRRIVLEQSRRANVGHIGSALSIADLVAAAYDGGLNIPAPEAPDRDRFVLSKGHAALALYAALHLRGWLPEAQLDTFCADESLLGVHPERVLRGVDFSTGSLGHGLSMGTGAALGARLQGSNRRTCVLLSDAECNEGSTWEAVMFAAHHRLSRLVALVDLNGQQALGHTKDVLDLSPMADRWGAFGWRVEEVDGHDVAALKKALSLSDGSNERPTVIIAHTTFGKGVSFMERQIKWHYLPMSADQFEQAMREIGARS
jgi:transketolase